MKNKLIIFLSILIVFSLSACGKDAPAAEGNTSELPAVEQTETVTPQETDQPEVTEAPEQEETPTEPEKEAPQEQGVSTEQSGSETKPEEQETEDKPAETTADKTDSDVDPGNTEQTPPIDETEETFILTDDISITINGLELHLSAGDEITAEKKEWLEQLLGMPLEEMLEIPPTPDAPSPDNSSTDDGEVPQETGTFPTTRTDAEVKEVINNFVDTFKNTDTYANLTGVAAEYVDENLNTLRNNPESIDSLKNDIAQYKEGSLSEDLFIYLIESWIRVGGPYGGQKISVQ